MIGIKDECQFVKANEMRQLNVVIPEQCRYYQVIYDGEYRILFSSKLMSTSFKCSETTLNTVLKFLTDQTNLYRLIPLFNDLNDLSLFHTLNQPK